MKKILFLILSMGIVSGVFAEEALYLSTMTVTAERVRVSPQTSISITRDKIKESYSHSIEDVLYDLPSFQIAKRGIGNARSDLMFRGSSFEQTAIYVNGICINNRQTGHHVSDIPLVMGSIEQIDVSEGGYAGKIDIQTGMPDKKHLRIIGGKNDLWDVSVGMPVRTSSMQHYVSIERSATNGYTEYTDMDMIRLGLESTYSRNGSSITLNTGYVRKDFGANGFYAPALSRESIEAGLTTLRGSIKLNENSVLIPKLSYRSHHDRFWYLPTTTKPNIHTTRGYGSGCGIRQIYGNCSFEYGIDTQGDEITSSALGNHADKNFGWYIEGNHTSSNITYHAKIRGDVYSAYPGVLLPEFACDGNLYGAIRWHATIAKGYRVPSFTELYYLGPGNIGFGNSSLMPEEAWNYSIGTSLKTDDINAQVTTFMRDETNVIDWGSRVSATGPWRTENIRSITTTGFETQCVYKPINVLKLGIAYTYLNLDTMIDSGYFSKYKLNYLRNQLSGYVDLLPGYDFKIRTTVTHKDRVNYREYSYVDTIISRKIKKGRVFLKIDNMFNEEYQEVNNVSMPGRWIYLGYEIMW